MPTNRGFGVAGALDHAIVRQLAVTAEEAGYRSLWVNDTPSGDGLASLAAAAEVTTALHLGVGVIPLDRKRASVIANQIKQLGLPVDRLTIGVGAGGDPRGLARVREGMLALRETGALVSVGALGPKMCQLAGEVADAALLNWLTPKQAIESRQLILAAAAAADRPAPRIDGYIRTALGDAALGRLAEEANRYASYPKYAAHFERMGVAAIETCVSGPTAELLRPGLEAFAPALDETIVRAITATETAEAYLALLKAVRP